MDQGKGQFRGSLTLNIEHAMIAEVSFRITDRREMITLDEKTFRFRKNGKTDSSRAIMIRVASLFDPRSSVMCKRPYDRSFQSYRNRTSR